MEFSECPVKDCTVPIDLVLQSNSGDKFGAHQHNLQTYSDAFPLSDSVYTKTGTTDDIPVLSESTDVLRLMLCFMHCAAQPDLQKLPFDVVAAFADAAEKYFIYSATGVCRIYMSTKVKEHPIAVLAYACKNQYDDIANQAAPLTLDADAQMVSQSLRPEHALRWFNYREHHLEDLRLIYNHVPTPAGLHKGGLADCGLWAPFELAVLRRLLKIKNVADARGAAREIIRDEMWPLKGCNQCTRRAENWVPSQWNVSLGGTRWWTSVEV